MILMIGKWSIFLFCFFFFSSRRRHTRFDCDWSSDVCSSDLVTPNRMPCAVAGIAEKRDESFEVVVVAVGISEEKLAVLSIARARFLRIIGSKRSEERRVGKECRCRWVREQ